MPMLKIKETAQFAEAKGSHRRIRLLNEGQGSSGFYSATMLKECGAAAFPAGTFLYFNHNDPDSRDIRDAFGVTTGDAVFEEENKGLWATSQIFETHKQLIDDLAPHAALSIEAAGQKDEDDNITEISPDPFNAVALVPRGGRDGKITEILESKKYANLGINENQRKEPGMTPEEIQKIAEALVAAMAPEFAKITEALKPAEVQEVEVDPLKVASEVAEALVAAELPKSARAKVLTAVEGGAKIEDAITAEKAYITELAEQAKESDKDNSRLLENKTSDDDFSVSGW